MISKKFLTSFICLNSAYLTKCERIEFSLTNKNLKIGTGISFEDGKWILSIGCFKNFYDFKNTMYTVFGNKKLKINSIIVKIKKDKDIVELKDKEAFCFASKIGKSKSINSDLYNIIIDFENTDKKNYKILFDENNFYDKDYFIGDNLTKFKEKLVKLNGNKISEDELNKKINELKDKYLKKGESSYYDIINTEKTGENINIKVQDLNLDDIKGLLNEKNYVFSLFKEDNTKKAPDYKTNKNKKLYEFLEGTGAYNINKDKDFFYKKFTVNEILEMIKNKLIEYSDKDKNNKVPYNFEIELLDNSENKINSSDSILEGGEYHIKIKDLFITKDQDENVTKLEKLIKELENKSKKDTPFDTVENGNKYITDNNNNFNALKTDLKKIEFCKLFLEKNEDLFKIYIGILTDKIKLLGVDEDVKKIINEINQKKNNFIEEIKTWQYTNFSDYLDETKKIKNEKVKEYINTLITDAKNKNKGKEAEITKYYTEDTINNEINNINTSLNARLNELKYSINLVIKDNKKFKNEKNNDKFKVLVDKFKVCYEDYTFECLLLANLVGCGIFNESDRKIINNTKFYVNGTVITNLKDVITKNSTVEIEFDSSLYKDKKDKDEDKHKEKGNEDDKNKNNNGNKGNDGNGEEVKKGCCVNKFKCSGCQKNNK